MKKSFLALVLTAAACSSKSDTNTLPSFVRGDVVKNTYDGSTNDLLTGGIGKTGLGAATPPGFANAAAPTPAELRTRAIWTNYRALVDSTAAGGYGVLYGPNLDVNGNDTGTEGKIAGDEWLAYDDDGTGHLNVTMMVQVPASFDPKNPCMVTATSSGSRGVYGAIATAGEWGLKHGCAVAYTDKGSGTGLQDLQNNTVNLIDGTRADAAAAGTRSNFTAQLSGADLASFNAATPNRFAVKHAHSQVNPEKDWGTNTLHAIEFGYYMLNEKFGTAQKDGTHTRLFHPGSILTIAASVSNGGGAALAAAEQDTDGYIKGVVAGEPQVQVASTATIQRGGQTVAASAKSLYDYVTLAQLYQPCAALASSVSATASLLPLLLGPNANTDANNRCASLQAKGFLTAADPNEALAKLHAAGWEADSDLLQGVHFSSYATPAVAVTYANAYSRASVKDNLCGYSFAAVDSSGAPVALGSSGANFNGVQDLFALGNGVPPSAPIQLINNNSSGGPLKDQVSLNAAGQNDLDADGAACLRELATGTDGTGMALTGTLLAQSQAVKAGIQQVLRSAKLHGVPAILVQGRSDALVPINHASRAYFGANKLAEPNSTVSYYEVQNANHFDAFIPFTVSGGDQPLAARFVPLHRYVQQSLDLMYAHLKSGAPLPASQVVRTTPRGYQSGTSGKANNIAASNVPPIAATPASADAITFASGTLSIPE